jgi:hypothetical protein
MGIGMSCISRRGPWLTRNRMQIHVQIQNNGHVEIAIFSKSKRNSTQDRLNTHSYVSLTSDLIVADEVVSFTPRSTSLSTRIYLLIPSWQPGSRGPPVPSVKSSAQSSSKQRSSRITSHPAKEAEGLGSKSSGI